MKYARTHIKRFWAFQNRRALGISFLSFAIIFGIGIVFTVILNQFFMYNPMNIFFAWIFLLALASIIVVVSLTKAHIHIASAMNKSERVEHSKYVGRFLIVMIAGIIVFMLPVVFAPLASSLVMLFSIGGILMVLYLAISLIFKHRYHEIAIASLLIWASFLLALFVIGPQYYYNPPLFDAASFLVASIVVLVIFSVTGMAMLVHSSNEFINEFMQIYKIK